MSKGADGIAASTTEERVAIGVAYDKLQEIGARLQELGVDVGDVDSLETVLQGEAKQEYARAQQKVEALNARPDGGPVDGAALQGATTERDAAAAKLKELGVDTTTPEFQADIQRIITAQGQVSKTLRPIGG